MVQRAQSLPRGSDFPFSSHRWAIWSSQGWIPCTRLCSWLGREWQVCCASEIWLSSSVTCRVSVGRLGRGIPCDQKHTERTSSLLRNLSSLQSTSPFAAKPKFNGFSHRGMEKSVFIGIWTNYLGKSKRANYTIQPSANDCQFRFWLLRPAHGPICMGQFTKPSFKGLIFTVIWGNIIVIITIVVIVIFATASLKMRRNLGAKGHSQGHTASGEWGTTWPGLPPDTPAAFSLGSLLSNLAFPMGQGIVPPEGEIWFLEEQKNLTWSLSQSSCCL